MEARRPESSTEADRWNELLDQLVDELPQLAQVYVDRVSGAPGYEPGALVTREDLLATAVASLRLLIEGMRDGAAHERLSEVAESLGRRRARQQVPAESLTMAMQSDFSVIWSRLLELSGSSDNVLLLARQVEPIWRVVEEFSNSTMKFYRQEELRLAQDRLNHRQVAIGRLLSFDAPSEASVAWVASELDCDAAAQFTVVVADQEESRNALFELATSLRRSPFFFHRSSGVVMVFWPHGTAPAGVEALLPELRCARADEVNGLADIPRTFATLTALLETVDPAVRRPIDLEEGLPLLARRALLGHGVDIEARLAAALQGCSDADRERLRETVVAYLATGSVQQTAATLFYHRNTVLKRLNRFADLTGIDVTVPSEAATVVIAWSTLAPE